MNLGRTWDSLFANKSGKQRERKRESLKQMQGEVIFSGWLLSVPVRLTSVRFTSVHGELRFKGELIGAVLG